MTRIPIALEMWSVREDFNSDPLRTLGKLADMGYEGVEFAHQLPAPAANLRQTLDRLGLGCAGWHCNWNVLNNELDRVMDDADALGCRNLVLSGMPKPYQQTKEKVLEAVSMLNAVEQKVAARGFRTGVHWHYEFRDLGGGETPWDVIAKNTGKDFIMQMDTGNAMVDGASARDVVNYLNRYPGRGQTVHLKSCSPDPEIRTKALIHENGDGVLWDEVFQACEGVAATEWYVVEYEDDAYPALEAVERFLKKLKELGK